MRTEVQQNLSWLTQDIVNHELWAVLPPPKIGNELWNLQLWLFSAHVTFQDSLLSFCFCLKLDHWVVIFSSSIIEWVTRRNCACHYPSENEQWATGMEGTAALSDFQTMAQDHFCWGNQHKRQDVLSVHNFGCRVHGMDELASEFMEVFWPQNCTIWESYNHDWYARVFTELLFSVQ